MSIRRQLKRLIPLALFAAAPAMAQAVDAGQAPNSTQQVSNANMSVNETYNDWTVRCFQVKSIAPCDMVLVASNKQTNQRVLLVSIAYVPSKDSFAMQMIVPLGVSFAKGMGLAAGNKSLSGVAFNRCERDGCYVEIAVPAETLDALTKVGDATTISLTPYGKTDAVKLPLSLKGFGDALDKMKGYARTKATNPPPQPAQQ
jgi:invasion protein IalB